MALSNFLQKLHPKTLFTKQKQVKRSSDVLSFISSQSEDERSSAELATVARVELVKARPLTLDQRYNQPANEEMVLNAFQNFKRFLYAGLDQYVSETKNLRKEPRRFIRESGRIADQRSYFYIQPLNEMGLLFEQSGNGWIISRAQKIVTSSQFLRTYDNWDMISIFASNENTEHFRVSSQRFSMHLVSFVVYQQKVLTLLTNPDDESV